jgi:hypothetical protein
MAANTFAGLVFFCAGPGPGPTTDGGSGGTGGVATPLPNGDCPNPVLNPLNPVGSAENERTIRREGEDISVSEIYSI